MDEGIVRAKEILEQYGIADWEKKDKRIEIVDWEVS